jgi:hypothetical protein
MQGNGLMMPTDENVEGVSLKAMADAFIESVGRSRIIIVVIVFASVLALLANWNSWQGSWVKKRLAIAKVAYVIETRPDTIETLQKINPEIYADACEFIKNRNFINAEALSSYIDNLEKYLLENVLMLRIPIFGVMLDVNDLGPFGGLTFTIVLLWFRFHFWREYNNLKVVLRLAYQEAERLKRPELLNQYYRYIAMRQVLTVPRRYRNDKDNPWGHIIYLLLLLPFLVQGSVVVHDISTYSVGAITCRVLTLVSILSGSSFWLIIAFLTYNCLKLSKKIDNEWDKASTHVEPIPALEVKGKLSSPVTEDEDPDEADD